MANQPVLHIVSNKQPSILNGEMLSGAAKGAIVGSVIGGPVVGTVVGAIAGGVGKHIQDNQSIQRTGGVVETFKPPSIFNREALAGSVLGAAAVGTTAFTIVGGAAGLAALFATPLILPILAVGAAVPVIGGMIGGSIGKGRMEKEYAAAEIATKQQAAQSQLVQARARSADAGMSYKNSAPLAEIEAGRSGAPVQGGAVERVLAARQAAQTPQLAGSPT